MADDKTETVMTSLVSSLPSLLWVVFAIIGFIVLYQPIRDVAYAIAARIKSGAQTELGPIKLEEIKITAKALTLPSSAISVSTDPSLNAERKNIYSKNHYYFITHRLYPSIEEGQTYDIWIYVTPHGKGIGDIKDVSYYFGPAWGDRVYTSKDRGKSFGIVVSAFGPMLAYVTINLKNGEAIETWSYIDFENGSLGSRGGI